MTTKLTIKEIRKLSKRGLSKYIENITQTPICADAAYCKTIVDLWIKK